MKRVAAIVCLCLIAAGAFAQEAAPAKKETTAWEMIKHGGPTLVVLVLCSIFTLTLIIERFMFYRKATGKTDELISKIKQANTLSDALNAIGTAPGNYAATPEIQERTKLLREYLRKGSDSQHLFNRLTLLWASSVWPGLLTPEQQRAIVDTARRAQQDDGGWSVATFAQWKRIDNTQLDTRSDGYGTGLVTFVLQAAGVPRTDPQIRRGLDWLVKHQDAATGKWYAASLNKDRDPASDPGKFMSDAATAYAVLALTRP